MDKFFVCIIFFSIRGACAAPRTPCQKIKKIDKIPYVKSYQKLKIYSNIF